MAGADERRVAQVMGAIADRVCDQFQRPYTFPSFHERILAPYNYYDFGQVRPLAARSRACPVAAADAAGARVVLTWGPARARRTMCATWLTSRTRWLAT